MPGHSQGAARGGGTHGVAVDGSNDGFADGGDLVPATEKATAVALLEGFVLHLLDVRAGCKARRGCGTNPPSANTRGGVRRSALPAKAFWLPVMTMAPTCGSLSMASSARPSSSIRPSHRALSACGRFSWIRPTLCRAPVFCTDRYWKGAPARRPDTGSLATGRPHRPRTRPRHRHILKRPSAVTGGQRDVTPGRSGAELAGNSRCGPGRGKCSARDHPVPG